MSIVRLANSMTRGPVVASLTDNVSINACRTTPAPTKPACFDDPACLSKVVELVYCDQKPRYSQHNEHRPFIAASVHHREHDGSSSTYKKA